MITQPAARNILHELAKKYNLPVEVIDAICDSQYRCLRDNIRDGANEVIMLPKWGKYTVSQVKIKRVEGIRERIKLKLLEEVERTDIPPNTQDIH